MSDWLDSFREDTERIRLETEEIRKDKERLREENRKLRALSPEKLDETVKKSTIMTELQQELLINKLKEIANEKTCYEMYGDFYDGIPQPTTRIFGDGIDYGKINLCRELLKLLEIEE